MFRIVLMIASLIASAAPAQELSGLARVLAGSHVSDTWRGIEIELELTQGVPYRVYTLDAPRRLVIDFREVDWHGIDAAELDDSDRVTALRMGGFRPGWSRMVADLDGPYLLDKAALAVDEQSGAAKLRITLDKGNAEQFADQAGLPDMPGWDMPEPKLKVARQAQSGEGLLRVVLDPGHGGIDPGAERGGLVEKDLMLRFARELKELLIRSGRFEVVMTRNADEFVSLERRVTVAHRARADVFISLHADALREGEARGGSIYTLSENASDAASRALAERHDRADMLAGIDLSGRDDVVADILIDLARMETRPRTERLAGTFRAAMKKAGLTLHPRPLRHAGFSVLKSPDIPSVLIEIGFLSSELDRLNLADPNWRLRMAAAIRDGLAIWQQSDAMAAELVRQ